ncbi:hypothetical protein D9619_010107 [Psilocybe cf. subviscida]|uniref:Uncharacterized protein n=1 Tax=Psilocybe cf. subviscida TaxID=2480587 RepID=A0A8H5BLF5_9AGAR|nr:hypothetical protein D9619_010107 [Psilocybe cf. subviscida]
MPAKLLVYVAGIVLSFYIIIALNQMPLLEHLSLRWDEILQPSHAPLKETPRIQLSCLRYLKVHQTGTQPVLYLLLHLIMPKLKRVIVNILELDGHNNDYPELIRVISSTVTNSDFGHLDSMFAGERHFLLSRSGKFSEFEVDVRFLVVRQYVLLVQQIMDGIAIIPSNNFVGLHHVSLACQLDCYELAMLLGQFPRLKSLFVYLSSTCAPLAQALEFGTLGSSNPTPLLRTLENITFSFVVGPKQSAAMLVLYKSLLARHKSGFGIKTLRADISAMPDGMIKQFEDIGICVENEGT